MAGAVVIVWSIGRIGNGVIYAFQMMAQEVSPWVVATVVLLPTAVPLVIGIFLLTFPGRVTNFFVRGDELIGAPPKVLSQIEGVVYSLLGLYLVIDAITDGVYHYSRLRLYQKTVADLSYHGAPALLPEDFGHIIATGIQFVLGVALIFGALGLAKLFRRLRGRDDAE
jgi:hypothetical protein